MTREKAIEMLEYIRHTGNGESEYKNNAQGVALDMAIKALEAPPNDNWEGYSKRLWKSAYERGKADAEQTSALDKIIAEIVQMPAISFNANDIYKADVLAIINKYKVENEGEE